MKIDPGLEAFFVAVALQHGTHPMPQFGIERARLESVVAEFMKDHAGQPPVLDKVRRNYAELGGKLLDTDPFWFYTKLAGAYLDWLYMQPESQALMPDALAKIDNDVQRTIRERSGISRNIFGDWKV